MKINAGAPLPVIITGLQRAGWGEIRGRQSHGWRLVLHALNALLPAKSAAGHITAAQIADTAGLSERWTRLLLNELEAAGVLYWFRGTIVNGEPRPGFIRVSKAKLVELLKGARLALEKIRARRREAYQARLKGIKKRTLPRFTSSLRAELSGSLSPLIGETTPEDSLTLLNRDVMKGVKKVDNENNWSPSACLNTESNELLKKARARAAATRPTSVPPRYSERDRNTKAVPMPEWFKRFRRSKCEGDVPEHIKERAKHLQ